MALAPSISTGARNAAADAVTALVNAGTPPGQLKIYAGAVPADVNAALGAATLLATLNMSATAFGAAVTGVATAAAIASATAAATGTATFFRITNAAGTAIIQGNVGTSAADLNLSSVAITSGGTVSVSSLTYTQAGS